MKKNKFLTLLFCLSLATICIAQDYTSQEDIKRIADETQKCIDTNYMTDLAMMKCTNQGREKYNAEIKKTLEAGKKYLSQAQYKQLLKTQSNWERFMQENNKLLAQTYEKQCPPYLSCLCASSKKYEYTKSRAEELSGFIGLLLLFKEEGVIDDKLNIVPFDY